MFVNKKDPGFRKDSHKNFMGGLSYELSNPLTNLRIAASSCFFGEPMYYHRDPDDKRPLRHDPSWRPSNDEIRHLASMLNSITPKEWYQMSPKNLIEKAIDDALEFNADETLRLASLLRNEDYIRVTPQIIMVRAANHKLLKGSGLIGKWAQQIMQRADEPSTQLAYQLSEFGKPIPNSLKRAWREKLQGLDEYQLAKYRMEGRVVKTIDVVRLTHAHSEPIDKLVHDELKITGKTWEAIISAEGSTKEAWLKAIKKMGHMALLRNIRNLVKVGIEPNEFMPKLIAGVERGKQLPFRYYSAYRANRGASPLILDGIEECLEKSLVNLPHFDGKVMSLSDNSGSARGTATSAMGSMEICNIGNLSAIITGKISDEGYIGIFGDRLATKPVRKKDSIFSMVDDADRMGSGVGGGTENGIWLFWDRAIRENQWWDKVFIYSDMQAGHGGLYGIDAMHSYRDYIYPTGRRGGTHMIDVPKLINHYRSEVNKNVEVFCVQIAGYQDTIMPEFFNKTYILGGWGPGLWRFADKMSQIVPKQ